MLVVLLAGCGGAAGPTGTDPGTSATTTTPTATGAQPDNPWGADPIRVAVVDPPADRDVRPLVRDALSFWSANAARYTNYSEVSFALVEDVDDANLVIRFEESVDSCGLAVEEQRVGCAEGPPPGGFDSRSTVRIETGYDDESTRRILKHEIGHALGLGHQPEPPWMTASFTVYPLPMTNLTDREIPWQNDTVRVAIDASNLTADARPEFRSQVRHAIEFYDRGGDGTVPDRLAVREVASPANADIVVTATTAGNPDLGSKYGAYTTTPDRDPTPEYYVNATVTIHAAVGEEAYGWHAAYWMATLFGVAERPPYLSDDASSRTRRSRWWENA